MGKKKEAAKLEAREAELVAELERRKAKKAAKKAKKKAAKTKSLPTAEERLTKESKERNRENDSTADAEQAPSIGILERVIAAADKVLAGNSTPGAIAAAETAKAKATPALDPETQEIAERVAAKRAARQALADDAESIDRDDEKAVRKYNAQLAELGGGTFLTSTATMTANDARMGDPLVVPSQPFGNDVTPTEPVKPVEQSAHAAEAVETKTGAVITVGGGRFDVLDEFAKPSEAEMSRFEEGGKGYKIIQFGEDGRPDPKTVRQYTRVTTYIDNLEYKGTLEAWKMRTLLEGIALNDVEVGSSELSHAAHYVADVRDAMHVRDVALAKARKADRKGKLAPGELADLEHVAGKTFKGAVDVIVEAALRLGGVHEKAQKGTDLHALCELYDAEGMEPITAKREKGDITPADHADIVAYAAALDGAGVKILESETVIVNDAMKYAGRLDRIVMAKLAGARQATKMVADIKTGRVDYGAAKIAQQIAMYAAGDRYNLTTGERSKHGASRSAGLLIHLPAGKAECTIHVVDLTLGAKGNKLSGDVREWRNVGKKAVDLTVDLATQKASK